MLERFLTRGAASLKDQKRTSRLDVLRVLIKAEFHPRDGRERFFTARLLTKQADEERARQSINSSTDLHAKLLLCPTDHRLKQIPPISVLSPYLR